MTAANVLTFFAEDHWGSRYGVIDQYHPTHHKGLDCGLFHGIIDVPALHAGTVVEVGPSSSVGHYVTVRRPDRLFDTYCHIVPGVSVGEAVTQGQRLGRQAVNSAEGGVAWKGQHTHLCLSDTIGGWAYWGAHNLDPTPGVTAVLTSTAGGGSSPLMEGSNDMHVIRNIEAGHPTSGWTALVGEFTFYHHPSTDEQRFDSRVWEGAVDVCQDVNNGEFEYAMAQAQARIAARDKAWGGGSGSFPADYAKASDVAATEKVVTTAIAGVPAAVIVEQKKPGN